MSQRPVKLSTIHRVGRTPETPPASDSGGNADASASSRVTWVDPATGGRAETPPPATVPTTGESLPDTSGGRICDRCGAYVVRPDLHGDWHRKLDRHIRLTLDVFQARGDIAKGGDSAATNENKENL